MNILSAEVLANGKQARIDNHVVALSAMAAVGSTISIGFRPEHCFLGRKGIPARVNIIERLRETGFVHCRTISGQAIRVEVKGDPELSAGAAVNNMPDASHTHMFNVDGVRLPRS